MATNSKVTVEDVKKAATEAATSVKAAAAAATEAVAKATEEVKKDVEAAKKEADKKATAAKKTATKTATSAKKTATTAKKTATKAVAKAKKEVVKSAVVQYQGIEFTTEDALKKAEAGFKKDYKGKTIEEINIYIKPEERKIYYVVNKDCVGSVDL